MTAMWNKKRQTDEGFTLLEIVISIGLIATALLAVFQLQAQNLDLQSEAQFLTTARCLGQDRISQVQSLGTLTEGTFKGDFGDRYPYFSYREEISQVMDLEGLYRIRLQVMMEQQDTFKDLKIETYVYRWGT